MSEAEQSVSMQDLYTLNPNNIYLNKVDQSQQPLLDGKLAFYDFQNGLTVHTVDTNESRDGQVVFEVPPGVSFNFLFEGEIHFSLGAQQHHFEQYDAHSVKGVMLIAHEAEVLTRYLKRGARVKKVNVFIGRDWLQQRCAILPDDVFFSGLFNSPGIYQWQPRKTTVALAKRLLNAKQQHTLAHHLLVEQLAVSIAAECLEGAFQVIDQPVTTQQAVVELPAQLKSKVDACLHQPDSLVQIAEKLNVSVSTLQRRFKRDYGVNIACYIKQRRLMLAKQALLAGHTSIGEVAFESGYKHASNFIAAFKKQFGATPAAYIKAHTRQ